jgi:hypothetical protein
MRKLLAATLIVALAAPPALATDIYANKDTGTDNSTCGASVTPCKTPQYALDKDAVNAGETLWIVPAMNAPGYYCVDSGSPACTWTGDNTGCPPLLKVTADDAGATIDTDAAGTQPKLYGLDCNRIDDSLAEDCSAGGCHPTDPNWASPFVFKLPLGARAGKIKRLFDVNRGQLFNVVCQQSTGDNTNVAFPLDDPPAFYNCANLPTDNSRPVFADSFDCVAKYSGSFYVPPGGEALLVHYWDDESLLSDAQGATHDLESSPLAGDLVQIIGADVTVKNLKTQYGNFSITGERALIQSGEHSSGSMSMAASAHDSQIDKYLVHDAANRKNVNMGAASTCTGNSNLKCGADADCAPSGAGTCRMERACIEPGQRETSGRSTCGWCDASSGTVLKVGGDGNLMRAKVTGTTVWNGWNAFGFDSVTDGLIEDVLAKNCPNHALYLSNSRITSTTFYACTNNTVRRSLGFNGQDGIQVAGCTDTKLIRNVSPNFTFYGHRDSINGKSDGGTIVGNLLMQGIKFNPNENGVTGGAGLNAFSNRNWINAYQVSNSGGKCKDEPYVAGTITCTQNWSGTTTAHDPFDPNSIAQFPPVDLKLEGFDGAGTWPPSSDQGLAAAAWTRRSFFPKNGSPLIDAGGTDYDGDRLEDDAVNAGTHGSGAAFDIGPGENGIDATTQPPPGGGLKPGVSHLDAVSCSSAQCFLKFKVGKLSTDDLAFELPSPPAPPTFSGIIRYHVYNGVDPCFQNEAAWTGGTTPAGGGALAVTQDGEGTFAVTGLAASTAYCFGMRVTRSDNPATNITPIAETPTDQAGTVATTGEVDCSDDGTLWRAAVTNICTGARDVDAAAATEPLNCQQAGQTYLWAASEIPQVCQKTGTDVAITVDFKNNLVRPAGGATNTTFLHVKGDSHVIQNVRVDDFNRGIVLDGRNATDGVAAVEVKDSELTDCLTYCIEQEAGAGSQDGKGTNKLTDVKVSGCDLYAGIQATGIATNAAGHTGNDLLGTRVIVQDCVEGFRFTGPGRFELVDQNVTSTGAGSCVNGIALTGALTYLKVGGGFLQNCKRGIKGENGPHLFLAGNTKIRDNRAVGVSMSNPTANNTDEGRVVAEETTFERNGGSRDTGGCYGAVCMQHSAQACLGGCNLSLDFTAAAPTGSLQASVGHNIFTDNYSSSLDVLRDLVNGTADETPLAKLCCFGLNDKNPSPQVYGTWTTAPLWAACGGPSGGGGSNPYSTTLRAYLNPLATSSAGSGGTTLWADAGTSGNALCGALVPARTCSKAALSTQLGGSVACDSTTGARAVTCVP